MTATESDDDIYHEVDLNFNYLDQKFRAKDIEYYEAAPVHLPQGSFTYVGHRPREAAAPADSNIKDSPLKGVFPATVAPAVMHACNVKDPSKLLLNALGKPDILVTQTSKWG
eukprot:297186_1